MRMQSGGKLPLFVDGIRALASGLTSGDRVLMAEACNWCDQSHQHVFCCCRCTCRQSGGKLPLFVDGIRPLASGSGDRVLIAKA